MSGGLSNSSGVSAEVYIPSTGLQFKLPDMSGDARYYHTMHQMTVYGGFDTRTSCLTLRDGTWETTTTLPGERSFREGFKVEKKCGKRI